MKRQQIKKQNTNWEILNYNSIDFKMPIFMHLDFKW